MSVQTPSDALTTTASSRSSSRLALREIDLRSRMDTRNSVSPFSVDFNVPDSILTPSPDELVIRQRGRKQRSQISAEMQCQEFLNMLPSPTKPKSPVKSPRKLFNLPTRSSPRKRLQLSESPTPPVGSVSKAKPVKRERSHLSRTVGLSTNLKQLSHDQLADLIERMLVAHPDMEREVRSMLPSPGLHNLEERLVLLRHDIFGAFSGCRLGRRSADCYDRIAVYVDAFKKECLEQSRTLLSRRQWSSVVDHVVLAHSYVASLPDLEWPVDSDPKKQCLSALAANCLTALKSNSFDTSRLSDISKTLKKVVLLSPEFDSVRDYVKDLLADGAEKSDSEGD